MGPTGPLGFLFPSCQLPDFFLGPLQGLSDLTKSSPLEGTGVAAESEQYPLVNPTVTGMLHSPQPTGLPSSAANVSMLRANNVQLFPSLMGLPTFLCRAAFGKQDSLHTAESLALEMLTVT